MKKLLFFAALAGCATAIQAQSYFFNATLSGVNEAPTPNASPALGFASVTLTLNNPADLSDDTLSYSVSYVGLTGNSTAAHIHGPALIGAAAGVIQGLVGTTGTTAGTFAAANVLLSPATAASLENALLTQVANVSLGYVNVHSTAFPGGEIRGQLIEVAVVPEVDSALFVGGLLGAGALAFRLRRK